MKIYNIYRKEAQIEDREYPSVSLGGNRRFHTRKQTFPCEETSVSMRGNECVLRKKPMCPTAVHKSLMLILTLLFLGGGWNVLLGQDITTPVAIMEITASSSSGTNVVSNINDNINDTYWSSQGNDDKQPYIILDLGSVQEVDVVNIRLATGSDSDQRPTSVTIQYSIDNEEGGNTAVSNQNLNRGDNEIDLNNTISARYIKLSFAKSDNNNQIRVYEISLEHKISYSDITILHKAGQWYDSFYQDEYPRTEVTDLYGNDTFDETNLMITTEFGHSMQNTHVYEVEIYMNPGQSRTLTLPGIMLDAHGEVHLAMYNYQRWYDYKTDGIMNNLEPTIQGRSFMFENGLIGGVFIPEIAALNIDKDFDKGLASVNFTMPTDAADNAVYYVACDQSNYTDVSLPTNSEEMYEPTLSQRAIFVIRNASVIKDRIANLGADEYLEDYTIHFPTTRISSNTVEQVALSMPAQNYFCEGEDGSEAGALFYEIDYPSGQENQDFLDKGVRYNDEGISQGEKTRIEGDDRIVPFIYEKTINDGDIAYIYVYKDVNGRKNIARFTLIFDENTHGLPKSDIDDMQPSNSLYFRTNEYMESQNYELLTKMNLDYENVELERNANYFPYPMNWTYSSYGFYTTENIKQTDNPQWGEYAITKSFPWAGSTYQSLNPDGFHLYVDANERPGIICALPFRESLCPGAMLYVTAWIANLASDNDPSDGRLQCDASVIFVLKGIKADDTEDIIYRQASGQIPYGEWRQLYFTYHSGNNDYERYVLQIENNCANTRGADFCIDDIRVYMNPLDVEGHTTAPICSGGAAARIELQLDYDLLLNRLGMEETTGTGTQRTGYYSFLNKAIYDNTYDGTNYKEAFSAAVLHGSGVYIGSNSEYYGSITFSNNPNENNGQDGMANLEKGALSFISEIAMNASADGDRPLQSGEEYYIVFNASTFDPGTINSLAALADAYAFNTRCTVKGEFLVEGPLIVRVNGDLSYDASTPCVGQVPHVEVLMKDADGNPVEGAVFDWYFGTLEEFKQEGVGDRTLFEILDAFRHFYPTITSVGDNVTPQNSDGYELSQEEIDYIKTLNEEVPEGGQNPKLTLSASSDLLIRLRSEETHVVLIPIGEQTDDSIVCWEPSEITLYAQDGAPTLFVGYEGIQYPAYATGTGVSVRMDLEQMNTIKAGSTPLSVPVREPKLNGNPTTIVPVDNDRIAYLAFTDDPLLRDEVGTGFDYEIGSINNFQISSGQNYVHFNFNNYFTAREGYRYYVTFRFRTTEQTGTSEEGAEACYGNAVVPILIVPEYEVWVGGADGNWNSDANWRRADKDELLKDATDTYLTNTENGTSNGFVPIFSTKIIIPQEEANNQIQLYTPVRKGEPNERIWNLTQGKDGMTVGDATNNIEYDLVMRTTDYTSGTTPVYQVRPYYTNVCEQIHFAPTATMFHQERLNYQKAWVEFEMDESKPYWMSSPLKDVYAGDMYATKGTGRQETELFKEINYDETNYDRWNPAFYQKAWDKAVSYSNDADGNDISEVEEVNINWSIEYNDVTVPYSEGKGFYSRVENISGDKALVRLPKADTDYKYYKNVTTRALTDVNDRTNAYKLALDNNTTTNQISVSLVDDSEAVDGDGTHFLVGNPFMTYLNMSAFFAANGDVLESKYWTLSDGTTKAVVGTPDVDWGGNETEGGTDDQTIDGYIKPMTAFFVEKKATAAKNDIVFTTSMMADKATATAASNTTTRSYSATNPTLTITAERGETRSVAKLLTSDKADNGYRASEDAVVLLDSELDAAMVYTVSGSRATQVNAMKEISNVGLGVYNDNGDEATLTISGISRMASPLYLYDAQTRKSVELSGDSYTMQITGDSHGRYYLRNSAMAGELENTISIYSAQRGQVIVSALQPVREIKVFNVSGALVRQFSVNTTQYTFPIQSGLYIIYASDGEQEQTEKVIVR